jgi:large subunit ribosomal protein L25
MAIDATLKAEPRQEKGKSSTRKMRAAGRVPAVVYGHDEKTRMISLDGHELELLFKRVHWENTIIRLEIAGERGEVRALVREVQGHPFRGDVLHVDFQQIHAGERVHVEVPLRLMGNARGARAGAVLTQSMTSLEVWCTPDSIPDTIDVDVSNLGVGDSIHLRDVKLPAGVTTATDVDLTVCSVVPPLGTGDGTAEDAPSEPEVIRRGRDEAGQ